MNQLYPQSGVMPRPNASYPMADLQGASAYAAPLNYNRPKEVISGYDTKINTMTGQEIPDANFARGGNVRSEAGLASLLASRGRDGDSVLVHMTPDEVQGLQALALAHGGSLTINPDTGLPEASFLKKLLPMIAGFTLNAIAPGVGSAVGSALGLSGTAAGTVGTALLVGGTSALIEGDLKKGLMAGLGAYSGASLQAGLKAAAAPAPVRPSAAEMTKVNEAIKAAEQTVGATPEAVTQSMPGAFVSGGTQTALPAAPSDGLNYFKSANVFKGTPTAADLSAGRIANLANQGLGGLSAYKQGLTNLISRPESRAAFGEALGGGFKSPIGQTASKYAVLTGAMDAFTPEEEMPQFGSPDEDFMYYTPGGYNPRYGQGWNQPLFLPGTRSRQYRPMGMAGGGPVAFGVGGLTTLDRYGNVMVDPASLRPEGTPSGIKAVAPVAAEPIPAYTVTDPQQRRADVLNYIGGVNKALTVPYRPVAKTPVDTGGPGSGGGGPGGGGGGGFAPDDFTGPIYDPGNIGGGFAGVVGGGAPAGDSAGGGLPPGYQTGIGAGGSSYYDTFQPNIQEKFPVNIDPTKAVDEALGNTVLDKAKEKFTDWAKYRFTDPAGIAGTLIGMTGAGALGTYIWDKLSPKVKEYFAGVDKVLTPEEAAEAEAEAAAIAQTLPAEQGKYGSGGGGFDPDMGGPKYFDNSLQNYLDRYWMDQMLERRGYVGVDKVFTPQEAATLGMAGGGAVKKMQAGGMAPINAYSGAAGEGYNFGFAEGGSPNEYRAGGKFLTGDGDGMSDDIKANINGTQEARLADGEFVIPADVVSHLGNGSSNAGAKKLYAMMDRIREARTGKKKQAPAVKTNRFLPA